MHVTVETKPSLLHGAPRHDGELQCIANLCRHDEFVVDDVVWGESHAEKRRRRVQMTRHASSHIDVLADSLHGNPQSAIWQRDQEQGRSIAVIAKHTSHRTKQHGKREGSDNLYTRGLVEIRRADALANNIQLGAARWNAKLHSEASVTTGHSQHESYTLKLAEMPYL